MVLLLSISFSNILLVTCKPTTKPHRIMKTENTSTLLGRLLDKMRPSDLLHNEHRLALRSRVESLRAEIGLDGRHFGMVLAN